MDWKLPQAINSIAESFVLIDEILFLTENERHGIVMSVLAKQERGVTSIFTASLHFLITTIAGRYLAFDAERIQGVLANGETSLFHDPVVQGRIYRIVDLTRRLNLPSERLGDGTGMVLLANGDCRRSVRVDKVHGILEIQSSQVLSLPAQFRGPEQRWYLGMIPFDRSVALILNIAWILEDHIQSGRPRSEREGAELGVAVQGAAGSRNKGC